MTKRQAKIIAQLVTASINAGADFVTWMEELEDVEKDKVGNELNDLGWKFLERHGFTAAPDIPTIIAYAKANY